MTSRLRTCVSAIRTRPGALFFFLRFSLHSGSDYCGEHRSHRYTVSGDDHSLVCLHRDREANWNAHCFLTRHSAQISSPPTSTGGRDVFCGRCACGPSVKGIVGRRFGFGRVGVFANGRNSLAALCTVFFFSVPLIVSLPVTFSPLLQASCCFSPSSRVQHIFIDSESRAVGKPRAKCQGQKHICAWQFVDRVWFSWCSVFFLGIFSKWCNFTWKGEFQLCNISIYLHPLLLFF